MFLITFKKQNFSFIAFKKIMCYNLVPDGLKQEKAIKLGNKNKNLVTLQELGKALKMGRKNE
jgi:hypothetical protein